MIDKFKKSVIENKENVDFEKKRRRKAILLRNKFLGEWASSVLDLKPSQKKVYTSNVTKIDIENINSKIIIKKIEKDFIKKKINISYREIEFKVKDFYLEANVIIENKFKLNNWK